MLETKNLDADGGGVLLLYEKPRSKPQNDARAALRRALLYICHEVGGGPYERQSGVLATLCGLPDEILKIVRSRLGLLSHSARPKKY